MLTNPGLRWRLVKGFGVSNIALLHRCFHIHDLGSIEGLTTLIHDPGKERWLNSQAARVDHDTGMHRF